MLGLPMLEGTNPASCFPSSAIGCDAACYTHIWSQVLNKTFFFSLFYRFSINLINKNM